MRKTPIAALSLLLLNFTGPGQSQTDFAPRPSWMPPTLVRPPELDSAAARQAVARIKAAEKAREHEAALEQLGLVKGRHEKLVTPLCRVVTRSRHEIVRIKAARMVGAMRYQKAERPLLKAFKSPSVEKDPAVLEAVGSALGLVARKSLVGTLAKDFARTHKGMKRALVLLFGHAKDAKAVPLLADWIEQPRPRNVSSGSNPPADYWKTLYFDWKYIRPQVVWALWAITGQLFDTHDEVEAWLKEQEKQRG